MTRNKTIILALVLSVVAATTVIALEEFISVSDRVETESIPVISTSEYDSNSSIERFSSKLETYATYAAGVAHTFPHYEIIMPKYVTVGDSFDISIPYIFVMMDDEEEGIIDYAVPDGGPNIVYLGDYSGVRLDFNYIQEFDLQNKDDIDFLHFNVYRNTKWDRHGTATSVGLFYNFEGLKTVTYSFILNNTVSYPNNEFKMELGNYSDKYYLNQISPDTYEISKTLVVPNFGSEGEPQPPYPGRMTSAYPHISIGNDSTNTPSVDSIESLILLAESDEIDEILDDFGFETIEEFYYDIFTSELVDEFLELYPQYSNANFILPTLNWILPP